ncbi:MAG: hypothetical protein HZC29_03545 [Thaumarchaeota archaeon]|nr:hypothetical protein [Nitrososphaerota archaeon]
MVGMALSITLFVMRRYATKENDVRKEKPILNKCVEQDKKMTFSKSNLLQLNATIIAGLFILVAVQGSVFGGIPALIDADLINDKITKYNDLINDPTLDQAIKDEAKKRLVESTVDLHEYYLHLASAQKFQLLQFFFNPISFFWTSLGFFVISSTVVLVSKNENGRAFRVGEGFSISGFIWILVALYIYLAIPRF